MWLRSTVIWKPLYLAQSKRNDLLCPLAITDADCEKELNLKRTVQERNSMPVHNCRVLICFLVLTVLGELKELFAHYNWSYKKKKQLHYWEPSAIVNTCKLTRIFWRMRHKAIYNPVLFFNNIEMSGPLLCSRSKLGLHFTCQKSILNQSFAGKCMKHLSRKHLKAYSKIKFWVTFDFKKKVASLLSACNHGIPSYPYTTTEFLIFIACNFNYIIFIFTGTSKPKNC